MSTGWVQAGIAAVGVVGGLMGANKQQKQAQNAQDQANALNQRALDLQQKQMEQNAYMGEIARDQYDEYKNVYRPLERGLVTEAMNYGSPADYERAAADAQGAVSSQLGLARDRLNRQVGYDPSSAAAQQASANMELQGAAMGAQAQNAAREGVRDKAWARKIDALGLGKGLVTGASSALAGAANGYGSAAGLAGQLSLNSQRLAELQYGRAGQSAQNIGGMITGLGKIGLDLYNRWNAGNTYGSGMTYSNNGGIDNVLF